MVTSKHQHHGHYQTPPPVSSWKRTIIKTTTPSRLRRIIWILLGSVYLIGLVMQLIILPRHSQESFFLLTTTSTTKTTTITAASGFQATRARAAAFILPLFLAQSFTNGTHHPDEQRTVLSFTTVPDELELLASMVDEMVSNQTFDIFDAIHINIPWVAMRFRNQSFPHTQDIIQLFPNDPRIIIHRLMDYGPMTRYFGALGYEQHPDTIIIAFDIDTDDGKIDTLSNMVRASREIDPNAIWCTYGEDFLYINGTIKPYWETYDVYLSEDRTLAWTQVYFCRAARGFLIKPKFFTNFYLNASDYHSSCFWDDDRFISFQMAVLGIERKNVHSGEWYVTDFLPAMQKRKEECANGGVMMSAESLPQVVEVEDEPLQQDGPQQEEPQQYKLYQEEQEAESLPNEEAEEFPQGGQVQYVAEGEGAEDLPSDSKTDELPQQQRRKRKRRRRLGSLTEVNIANKADIFCTIAYLETHPHLFPLAYNVTPLCPEKEDQPR